MIAAAADSIRSRAEAIRAGQDPAHHGRVSVEATLATIGGGSLPGETLPSFGLAVRGASPERLLAALRRGDPCVIGRIHDGALLLDLRTVERDDDAALGAALRAALGAALD
jgi:L-seryl-tRNA(Ser) seleniumtransferase